MTRNKAIFLAAGGSMALLISVWIFQALGYPPCKLCVYQRWPHGVAVAIGVVALLIPLAVLPFLGALAALVTAGIGIYHTGVERDWWEGPTTCTSGDISGISPDQLLNRILDAPLIRCDEVSWQFLSLSMASWNVLVSLALAGIWLWAWRLTRTP